MVTEHPSRTTTSPLEVWVAAAVRLTKLYRIVPCVFYSATRRVGRLPISRLTSRIEENLISRKSDLANRVRSVRFSVCLTPRRVSQVCLNHAFVQRCGTVCACSSIRPCRLASAAINLNLNLRAEVRDALAMRRQTQQCEGRSRSVRRCKSAIGS